MFHSGTGTNAYYTAEFACYSVENVIFEFSILNVTNNFKF